MKPHLPKFLLAAILLLGNYANGATDLLSDRKGYTLYIEDANEFSVDATSTGTDSTTMIYAVNGMENTNFGISPGSNGLDATIGTLTMNAGVTATVQRNPWTDSLLRDFGSLTIKNLVVKGEAGANFVVEENQGPVVINAVSGSLNNLTNKGTLTLNGATMVSGTLTANNGSLLTVNDVLTITDASKNGVLSINGNSSIETGENGYINYSNANVTSYEVTLGDHTTLGKNFQFTGGLIINGKGYENARKTDRYIYVNNGKSLIVDGALDLVTTVHMEIEGGHVEADSLNMGHPTNQDAHYTGKLTMESGSLKLGAITFRKTYGSYANEFNVTGGTLEFTAENVLNKQVGAEHAIINITGSGSADSERVTLKATEKAWTIDGSAFSSKPSIGNVTIDAANTELITLKNVSLSGNIVNNAQLAIGSVTVGEDKTATLSNAGSGSVSFVSDSVLTLNEGSNLTLDNAGIIIFNNQDANTGIKATGSGTLTVGSGTIVQLTNSDQKKEAAVAGTIKVQGGGKLLLSGSGKSLLGYDDAATDAIYLAGEDNNLATMEITTTANQHLSTDLYLQGYAQIIGQGIIESYLYNDTVGKINVGGVSNTIDANIALNRALTINVAKDGELVVNGVMSATGGGSKNLIKEGDGTLTLSGDNTYTGTTTVSGGKVVVSGSGRLGKGDVTIANAVVELTGANKNTTRIGQNSSKVTINEGGKLTLKGKDALGYDGGSLGTLVLSGSAEKVAILDVQDEASLTLTTNVEMKGNSQITGEAFNTFETEFTITGSNNIIDAATLELRKEWNVNVQADGELEISSLIAPRDDQGGGNLIKKGEGILVLSGAKPNTYSTGTIIEAGVLKLKKAGALGTGAVEIQSAGTLELSGADVTVSAVTVDGGKVQTNSNQLTVSGATTVTSNGGTLKGSLEAVGGVQLKDSSDTLAASISGIATNTNATLTNVTLSNTGIGAVEGTQGSIANALVELQQNSAFSIADVTMSNVEISAAEVSTPVLLQPVEATNVSLTKGTFVTKATLTTAGDVAKTESGSSSYAYSTDALSGITLNNAVLSGNTDPSANIVLNLGGMSDFAQNAMGICDISITLTGFSVNAVDIKGIYFAADSWLGQLLAAQGVKDSILSVAQGYNLTNSASGSTNVSVGVTDTGSDIVINITGLDMVPEPTTTTLSLLALTALAARRRRR